MNPKMIVMILMLWLVQSCSVQVLTTPQGQAINVDGYADEWAGKFEIIEDQRFAIASTYDDQYLYLSISSQNRQLMRQIHALGLEVFLDGDGKRNTELAVRVMPNSLPRRNQRHPDLGSQEATIRLVQEDEMSLGPADLLTALHFEDGFCFEMQFPLRLLQTSSQELGIGVRSERPERPEGDFRKMQGSRGGHPGGGRQGGPQGGGRRGPGGSGQRPGFEDLEWWGKLSLKP